MRAMKNTLNPTCWVPFAPDITQFAPILEYPSLQPSHTVPLYPTLQLQVLTAEQVPFPLQTKGFDGSLPPHAKSAHIDPLYPLLQTQVSFPTHVPNPLQTVELVEETP